MEGGQTVHKFHIGVTGCVDDPLVNLIGRHQANAFCPGFFGFAHRDPDIGVEEIDVVYAFLNILCERNACASHAGNFTAFGNQCLVRPEGFRCDQTDIHPHFRCAYHQGITHVIAGVTEISETQLRQGFTRGVFQHGHQIREDLGGVKFICQSIPDRNSGKLPQFLHNVLAVSAIFNAVVHAA